MSKKYKNTKHKNPFREDRQKKPFPWLNVIFSLLFVTAAVLISVLVYKNFGSGVRTFTTDAPGSTAYDKRSGITYYYEAMTPYQAGKLKEAPYATCGDYTFYEIEGIDPKIMLHSVINSGEEDEIDYGLYCSGYEFPEPADLTVSAGGIFQTDLETIKIASLEKADAVEIMRVFLNGERVEYPSDIDGESILDIYIFSENYPHLTYTLRYFTTETGERYLSCREDGAYIKLSSDELTKYFPEE